MSNAIFQISSQSLLYCLEFYYVCMSEIYSMLIQKLMILSAKVLYKDDAAPYF